MTDSIYFINIFEIPTCQIPFVLKIIYFCKIIFNIIHIVIPIGLILYMMFDFSKCLIDGNESSQSKIVKVSFKRILYASIVYVVPYIVGIFATVMSDFVPDYNLCITNATAENIEVFIAQYEDAKQRAAEERREKWMNKIRDKFPPSNYDDDGFGENYENLRQCSGSWSSYPVCMQGKTICSSGCGYVAYTMVLRSFGFKNATPNQIVDIACNDYGYTYSAASIDFLTSDLLNNKYGLKAEIIANDSNISNPDYGKKYLGEVEKALENGKSLIILQPGHYLSILGINNDGTIIVGDSGRIFASTDKYTVESLYDATKDQYNDCETACGWTIIVAYSKK